MHQNCSAHSQNQIDDNNTSKFATSTPSRQKFLHNGSVVSNKYHSRLLPNIITGNNIMPTNHLKTTEEDHDVGLASGGKNNDCNSSLYIASKQKIQYWCKITMVVIQQKIWLWWQSPLFDDVANMRDDPENSNEGPIKITFSLPAANTVTSLAAVNSVSITDVIDVEVGIKFQSSFDRELKKQGQPVSGKKADLQTSLFEGSNDKFLWDHAK